MKKTTQKPIQIVSKKFASIAAGQTAVENDMAVILSVRDKAKLLGYKDRSEARQAASLRRETDV